MTPRTHTYAYSLRSSSDDDYTFLYALFVATMRSSIENVWGTWDESRWEGFFREHFDAQRYQVVVVHGQDIGALVVERRSTETYLDTVEVALPWQNRGLGTAIIRSVLRDSWKENLPVTLQVNRANRSRRLYERLGFIEVGRTETHYLMRASPP